MEKTKNSAMGIVSVFALTGFMGLTLGPIVSMYAKLPGGTDMIAMALGTTGLIFLTMSGWVLSKASASDQAAIEASTEAAISALPLLLDGEDVKAMTALHSESYAAKPPQED